MADFAGIFWAKVCTDLTNFFEKKKAAILQFWEENDMSVSAYSITTATETLTTLNFQVQHTVTDLS